MFQHIPGSRVRGTLADELATLFRRAELSDWYYDVVMRRPAHEASRSVIAADLGQGLRHVR